LHFFYWWNQEWQHTALGHIYCIYAFISFYVYSSYSSKSRSRSSSTSSYSSYSRSSRSKSSFSSRCVHHVPHISCPFVGVSFMAFLLIMSLLLSETESKIVEFYWWVTPPMKVVRDRNGMDIGWLELEVKFIIVGEVY